MLLIPSLHNISDQLFLSQSRSSPALGSEGSRKDDKVLAHSELVDRFKVLVQKATDFLFMSGKLICGEWKGNKRIGSAY